MANEQNVDLMIFGTKISVITDEPVEMQAIGNDLNTTLNELAQQYPNQKQTLILTLALLQLTEKNRKLKDEITHITKEKEKLNQSLSSFMLNID